MFESSDKSLYVLRRDSSGEYIENQKESTTSRLSSRIKEHIIGIDSQDPNSNNMTENRNNHYYSFEDNVSVKNYLNEALNIADEDTTYDDTTITGRDMMGSSNMFPVDEIHQNRFNRFARYGIIDPAHEHTGSREYLFFSKPDLHIFNPNQHGLNPELVNCPFFQNTFNQYPESLYSLQQTYNYLSSDNVIIPNREILKNKFIPLLSNQVSSSLDLSGISATETQNNSNLYQISTSYRDGSEISDCAFDFTLEFHDTKYLDVYMFFKAYDEYFRQKYLKNITPVNIDYIDKKINSDAFSIWKIIVDDTNTIMYWAKVIGVTPMSVPRDAMSNFDGPIKETINFKGQFVRDMNPVSLMELNHLSALTLGYTESQINTLLVNNGGNQGNVLEILPTFNTHTHISDTRWGSVPYIIKKGTRHSATNAEKDFYRLVWIKKYKD